MPDGVQPVSFRNLPGPSSTTLSAAVLDRPPASTSFVLADGSSAGPRSTVLPGAVPFAKAGVHAPAHGLAWHERVHVVPRRFNLGAVLADRVVQVEVYNSSLGVARVLTAIVVAPTDGVTVANPYGLPTHYPSTESRLYDVTALAEGPPDVDNVVTWVFTGLSQSGTTLVLVGFRVLPWPFEPNLERPIRERYGYLTDLIEAHDGSEQRVRLRSVPVGAMGLTFLLRTPREAQLANAMLHGNLARPYGVPLWQFANRLGAVLGPAALVATVETTGVPWRAGDFAILWRDPFTWEVLTVASSSVGSLTFVTGPAASWPVGTLLMPIVVGRLAEEQPFRWVGVAVGTADLDFDVDAFHQ